MANMAQGRACHVALPISKMLYVCGGCDGSAVLADCEVYDPAQQLESSVIHLEARKLHAGVEYESKLYCFGGRDGGAHDKRTTECLDPASTATATGEAKWIMLKEMPVYRHHHVAVVLKTGCIAIMGGIVDYETSDSVSLYHPEKNTWSLAAWRLPDARYWFSRGIDRRQPDLLIFDGHGPTGKAEDCIVEFD